MSYLPHRWISHWIIKNNYLFDCQWKTVDDYATFPYCIPKSWMYTKTFKFIITLLLYFVFLMKNSIHGNICLKSPSPVKRTYWMVSNWQSNHDPWVWDAHNTNKIKKSDQIYYRGSKSVHQRIQIPIRLIKIRGSLKISASQKEV